jgi:hypothetical protein
MGGAAVVLPEFALLALGAMLVWWTWRCAQFGWSEIPPRAPDLPAHQPASQPTKGTAMQIILSDFMSLDGVVQAPGGREEDTDGGFAHGGWSMPYFETMGSVIDEIMTTTEALLFGRRTWQTMAAAWPGRAGDPFADRMNEIPKYVASRTLTQDDLTWVRLDPSTRRRRDRRGARASSTGRQGAASHGQRLARCAADRARPR